MSLDKAIQHGKEHRKPYYKSGKYDKSCRPGGDCPYCESNRTASFRRRLAKALGPRWNYANGNYEDY